MQPANARLMQIMIVEYEQGRYYAEAGAGEESARYQAGRSSQYFLAIHAYPNARDFRSGQGITRHAAERFPDSACANFEYAFHLQLAGDTAKSRIYLEKAMAADPKYEEPFCFRGDLLVAEGQDEQAIPAELEEAVRLDPKNPEPHLLLSRMYYRTGGEQRASSEKEISLRLRRENPAVLEVLQGRTFR
jgi:Tfp pilus assembly protein PilF